MSLPRVVAVEDASPADRAGIAPGDEIVAMNGRVPRDVIQYRLLADEAYLELELNRGGLHIGAIVEKTEGQPLGIEVSSAVFDQIRTCDNHCEFCFIYQLPPGMRPSLYLKDDDYRLSFLYGNFTTLTRFTEIDLERVITEGLSPLFVSIHSTNPTLRSHMLRNKRGATSLRWLRALLQSGIEVHGQLVICPGVNDGAVLHDTLAGILDEYPGLASVAAVPLGISDYSKEVAMRPHSQAEAEAVVDAVAEWQTLFESALGHRMIFAADEYYLMAHRAFPEAGTYEGFPQHENGIGMARAFEAAFRGDAGKAWGKKEGFFNWVDGAPAQGYRAPRTSSDAAVACAATAAPVATVGEESTVGPVAQPVVWRAARSAPVGIVTGAYGAAVLRPLLAEVGHPDLRLVVVDNKFFGGNIGVSGLMVGSDLIRVLGAEPEGHRYLLPDVCLSEGRFLDGLTPAHLPRPVEIIPADGLSLRRALEFAS
ncbi:MAG: DUF512 domain-containing protein [Acidimicrobiales bacterium]